LKIADFVSWHGISRDSGIGFGSNFVTAKKLIRTSGFIKIGRKMWTYGRMDGQTFGVLLDHQFHQ